MLKKILITVLLLTGSTFASAQITQEFLDSLNEMTTPDLAARAEKAQKEAFEMFNELNDDSNFDVLCERIRETGSNMSVQKCEPRFVDEINMMFNSNPLLSSNESRSSGGGADMSADQMVEADMGSRAAENLNFLVGSDWDKTQQGAIGLAYEELTERINKLREENPEFHQVFTEYSAYTAVLGTR